MKQYKLGTQNCPDEEINVYSYMPHEDESEHTHDFLEIVYILSGRGQHSVNGRSYKVQRGNLLFINFGQTHAFSPAGEMEIVNCLVNPQFIDHELIHVANAMEILALSSFADFELPVDKLIPMLLFSGHEMLEVEKLLHSMIDEFRLQAVNYKTALKGYLLVLLTKIFRAMQQANSAAIINQMSRLMPEILQYIEDNFARRITLPELAQKCFYNPSYFSKVFKDYCGKNLTEFIAEKRILEASRLLHETGLSIEEIAQQVGYQDRKQFYEVYKKIMGVPPGLSRSEAAARIQK